MKKKKVTLARFTDEGRKNASRKTSVVKKKKATSLNSHQQKVKKIKEVSNGCWWIEAYLHDRCMVKKDK